MQVRAAVPDDAAHIARVAAATFPLACPPSTPRADLESYIATELSVGRFQDDIASTTRRLFAALVGGQLVGYLMLCRESTPPCIRARRALELRRLYVMPEHHGAGVAAALFSRAVREARGDASDVLWLSVSAENHRGIAFYRKNGFTVAGEQTFPVGSALHRDLLMSRPVALHDAPGDAAVFPD